MVKCKVLQVYLSFWSVRRHSPSFGLDLTSSVHQPPGRRVLLGAHTCSWDFLPPVQVGLWRLVPCTQEWWDAAAPWCVTITAIQWAEEAEFHLWDQIPTFFVQFIGRFRTYWLMSWCPMKSIATATSNYSCQKKKMPELNVSSAVIKEYSNKSLKGGTRT